MAQAPRTPNEEAAVAVAIRALTDRLQVPAAAITVARVAPVEWRDSSLGCPERGQVYLQQIVAGHEVQLTHAGRRHDVHVAAGRAVICSTVESAKVPPAAIVAPARKAADAVKAALAQRLALDVGEIRIDATRPRRTSTPSCPAAPGEPHGPAFIVDARAAAQTFRYYADDEVTVSCDAEAGKRKP